MENLRTQVYKKRNPTLMLYTPDKKKLIFCPFNESLSLLVSNVLKINGGALTVVYYDSWALGSG